MNRSAFSRDRRGFTLVELMTSLVVITMLVLLLASIVNQTSAVWRRTASKVEQFREVRAGFEAMTTRLAQATLNTYWDYDSRVNPTKYQRRSELRFISGPSSGVLGATSGSGSKITHSVFFQAPLGATEALGTNGAEKYAGFENLLCAWGYYVQYDNDRLLRPPFLPEAEFPLRHRFRLMELWNPAEKNSIYAETSGFVGNSPGQSAKAITYNAKGRDWFRNAVSATPSKAHVLAENVVALIITPRLAQEDEAEVKGASADPDLSPLAPNYLFDSAPQASTASDARYRDGRTNPLHQLPPIVQVTMVAIDEISANRLNLNQSTDDPFGIRSRFEKSSDYTKDLTLVGDGDSLENALIKKNVNYRIFSTNVVIRAAKWSRESTN